MVDVLKHEGTIDREREILKMSVKVCDIINALPHASCIVGVKLSF